MDKEILRTRIKEARESAGLSQEQVGAAAGVTRSAVQQWESGKSIPKLVQLVPAARACGVSLDWLTGRPTAAPTMAYTPLHTPEARRIIDRLQYVPPDCMDALRTLLETLVKPFDPRHQAFEGRMRENWSKPGHGIDDQPPAVPPNGKPPKPNIKRPR